MSDWLNEIIVALNKTQKPVQLFFRDDDAGWETDKLFNLLDRFAQAALPIDLAVIPERLDKNLVEELLLRWQQDKNLLGLHQHGFSHANHELNGRKCEFGSSRTKSQQKGDIATGKACLQAYLGEASDPFFTPPWNRCSQETLECLEELDFTILSRDVTATKFDSPTLIQVPVHIDWSRVIKQSTNPLKELGQTISQNLINNKLTGIMLHHADMDTEQLQPLTDLLSLLSRHQNAQGILLRDILK